MADYQLRKFTFIRYDDNDQEITITHEDILDKRKTPNTPIPIDEGNTDYQDYLTWVSEGNTPDPAS